MTAAASGGTGRAGTAEPPWGVPLCGSAAGLPPAPGALERPAWAEPEIGCKRNTRRGLRLLFVRAWGGWQLSRDPHPGSPALGHQGSPVPALSGVGGSIIPPPNKSWDFSPVLASGSCGYRISWVYCPAQQTLLPEQPLRLLAGLEAEISPQNGAGKKRNRSPGFCFRRGRIPSAWAGGSLEKLPPYPTFLCVAIETKLPE